MVRDGGAEGYTEEKEVEVEEGRERGGRSTHCGAQLVCDYDCSQPDKLYF